MINKIIVKTVTAASLVALASVNLFGCTNDIQPEKVNIQVEQNAQNGNGNIIKENEIKPSVGETTALQSENSQVRTVIENGEVKVWAETFNRDETIKPIKYEVVDRANGTKGHYIYYNVDGHEIKVAVNEQNGSRRFYKDGKGVDFAQIGSDVKSSNENILLQVKINDMLIDEVKKKYK